MRWVFTALEGALLACSGVVALAVALVAASALGACDTHLNLGVSEGGLDFGPPSCAATCDKAIACGYGETRERPSCLVECARLATPDDLACVANASCEDIVRVCARDGGLGGVDAGPDPVDVAQCQQACDSAQFFDCLDADQHASCRALCSSTTAARAETFGACVFGKGSSCTGLRACWDTFRQ